MTLSVGIFRIVLILFLVKIAYFIFACFYEQVETVNIDTYIESLDNNDGGWYMRIAQNGYRVITKFEDLSGGWINGKLIQSEWAFFPVYPALIAGLSSILGWDLTSSAILLSYIFSIAGFVCLFIFCNIFFNNTVQAFYTTLCVMLFPFHYYYSMFYTEALFFTFMISCFIFIYKKQYLLLAIMLIPLTLVRPNGIVVSMALYIFFLEQNNILSKYKIDWNKLFSKEIILNSFYFLTSPLALLGYCIYQFYKTGYFLAFTIAQNGWGKKATFPLSVFYQYNDATSILYSTYTILAMLVAVYGWRKLPLSLNILIWTSILIPLSSGSVLSMQRFISVIFPLFIIISYNLYKRNYRYLILVGLFVLQLLSYYYWFNKSQLGF